MNQQPSPLEQQVINVLRAAREPLREAVIHERVSARHRVDPDGLIAALERLATLGAVRVAVQNERRLHGERAPFAPRIWRLVD